MEWTLASLREKKKSIPDLLCSPCMGTREDFTFQAFVKAALHLGSKGRTCFPGVPRAPCSPVAGPAGAGSEAESSPSDSLAASFLKDGGEACS